MSLQKMLDSIFGVFESKSARYYRECEEALRQSEEEKKASDKC